MEICKLKSYLKLSSDCVIDRLFAVNALSDNEYFFRRFDEDNHVLSILIAEEFSLMDSGTISVTIIIDEKSDHTTVEIISNGGSVSFLALSYGAESRIAEKIVKALLPIGFGEAYA